MKTVPDPNRSTSINFVQVDGRSLCIVDQRIVVIEGENCHTPCKERDEVAREGEMSGEYVQEQEMCELSEFPWVPRVSWDSHGNENVLCRFVEMGKRTGMIESEWRFCFT